MTPEEINKAVAGKVINECFHDWQETDLTFEIDYVCKKCGLDTYVCQDYAGNISCAWPVVEKMREKGYEVHILSKVDHEDYDYAATFEDVKRHKIHDWCTGESAAMVISRAALKAVS
jgi:hypothetical protein